MGVKLFTYILVEKCFALCVVYECTRVVLGSMKCTLCWLYVLCKNASCCNSLSELFFSVRVASIE